jgi:hypothetical protein
MATPDPTPTPDPTSTAASQPKRLGLGYATLWTAASVSFVGDGIYYTALPLLAASLSRDPLVVAAVEVAGQLPWLLFALPSGAMVDRWDRRRVLWLADAHRSLVVAALAGAILAGWASIPLLGAAGFLLSIGGTLFNPAAMSIVPAIVSREPAQLERANGRLAAAQTVGEHFLGPPVGGVLFSLARSIPFLADAVSFAASSLLIASIRGRFAPTPSPTEVVVSLRQAIVPDRLVGRINSVFQLLSLGMLPLGAALGGTLGRTLGLRAPFLFGGVALLVMALLAVPVVTAQAIEAARAGAN